MMMDQPQDSQQDLDAFARRNGFKNYAQMKAWTMRRSESLQNSHTTAGQPARPAPAPPPRPVQQQPNEGIFGYIIRKMGGG